MTRALIIGPAEQEAIAALIAKAAAHVTPLEQVRRGAEFRDKTGVGSNAYNEASTIDIPMGFSVTYTHEEQPGAVCRHMSVSVLGQPSHGPNPLMVSELMKAFGFKNPFGRVPIWLDTLEDKRVVVNVVEPLDGDITKIARTK